MVARRPLHESFEAGHEGDAQETRDRAFVRRLATTTLRRLGQADALVERRLARGRLPAKAQRLRLLLAQAACELVFLGAPAYAVINSSVALARAEAALAGHAGLINAVLRRIARECPNAETAAREAPQSLNTPAWLARRWQATFGAERAAEIAAAHVLEPAIDLTLRNPGEEWAHVLRATRLPTGSLRRAAGGRIETWPGYAEGAWWIQDAAAALPARLLMAGRGDDVLDLCAAPGGKTAQLAATGARVLAVDRDGKRLARLAPALNRLGLWAATLEADIGEWQPPHAFGKILLDAPCSATGTLRRHPDIAYLKRESDIAPLAASQQILLERAFGFLARGGTLVYAVCSLEPEEGEARVDAFLAATPDAKRLPISADLFPGLASFVTAAGDLRTSPDQWPEWGGLDGFYAARLTKQ